MVKLRGMAAAGAVLIAGCAAEEGPPACADHDAAQRADSFYGYAQYDGDWIDIEIFTGRYDPPILFPEEVALTGGKLLGLMNDPGALTVKIEPYSQTGTLTLAGEASCDTLGTPWYAVLPLGDTGGLVVEVGPP